MPVYLPAAALSLSLALLTTQTESFEHLSVDDGIVSTQHAMPMRFEVSNDFQSYEATHRIARFNDVPFEISLTAFTRSDAAIMVHAEHVADGSGAANYDRMPLVDWPVPGFRSEGQICHAIAAEVVDEEHDLRWLRDRGFDPAGDIWIEQFFLSGNGYNDEIVISLILRGPSCENRPPDADFQALRQALRTSPGQQ